MTVTQDNYLDFGNLLMNEIIGSTFLFIMLGLVVIGYVTLRYRLSIEVALFMSFLWAGAITSYAYNSLLWMIMSIVIATIIYMVLPKLVGKK